MDAPSLTLTRSDENVYSVHLTGRFETVALNSIQRALDGICPPEKSSVIFLFEGVSYLDTGGACALLAFEKRLKKNLISCQFQGLFPQQKTLFNALRPFYNDVVDGPVQALPTYSKMVGFLEKIGQKTLVPLHTVVLFLSFWGEVMVCLCRLVFHPREVRVRAIVNGLYDVGVTAAPIVGLISFLIGIVLVYQGADQLRRFGAEIFTVDLLAISVLREIGVLLTALVVAGRSASAYTAGLGFMKLNQEIDALCVLGLNPMSTLIIPRLFSLVIALPLLVFFADMMALLGGAMISTVLIDLTIHDFLHHLRLSIKPWSFWVGMIKAPVFAYFIGLIACFEGMRLSGGSEEVGRHTTKSVVEGIFLVIVLDAGFSIFFSAVGV